MTGLPVRRGLKTLRRSEALTSLRLSDKKKTLLVMGGSQGSRAINRALIELFMKYDQEMMEAWQFIHLAGSSGTEWIHHFKKRIKSKYISFPYSDDMGALFAASDLVLCRAGASTLHELAYFEKTAILVPYPYARAHQMENAKVLGDAKGAWVLPQDELSAESIMNILRQCHKRPGILKSMGKVCSESLNFDGARGLTHLSLSMLKTDQKSYAQVS